MPYETPPDRPFQIEHHRDQETPTGFVPDARLVITAALRRGGLLAKLSDEQARTLLALLTFLTPNGSLQATAGDIAVGLWVAERQARKRLDSLACLSWFGEPVVYRAKREGSHPVYVLHPSLCDQIEPSPPAPAMPVSALPAGREAVVAFSRATYGRPRDEVERIVAAQLGHTPEEGADTPEGEARRRLRALGVAADEVEYLVAHFSLAEILQQLNWLSLRRVRTPARFIVAAIKGRYAPPFQVRLREALPASPPRATEADAEQTEASVPRDTAALSLPIPEAAEEGDHG